MKDIKHMSINEAAQHIQSGDAIWIGSPLNGGFSPFLKCLTERLEQLRNITLVGNLGHEDILLDPKYREVFHVASFNDDCFKNTERLKGEDIERIRHDGKELYETLFTLFKINTIAIEMSPPDPNGYCYVDSSGKNLISALDNCPSICKRIAIINHTKIANPQRDDSISTQLCNFEYVCDYCPEVEPPTEKAV